MTGVTVVTTLVCYQHTAHEAAGAAGARHSLRPLISESGKFKAKLARMMRRDREAVAASDACCLKIESVAIYAVITRESG